MMLPGFCKKYVTLDYIEYFGRVVMVQIHNPIFYGIVLIATILLAIAVT